MEGHLLPDTNIQPPQQPTTLETLRMMSMKAARNIQEKTVQAATATGTAVQQAAKNLREKDWTKEQEALNNIREKTMVAASRVGRGGAAVWAKTTEGLKKVFGGPLMAVAKQEANMRPCPRIVLVCCTAIASGGLMEENLFKEENVNEEDLYCLYGAFESAYGLVLPPAGVSPHLLAAVLKKFLLGLPEPLLTFKFLPDVISAARDPRGVVALLPRLPTVNFDSLHLLLDTLFRVSENAPINHMTPLALAHALAPCLAWHPVQKPKQNWLDFGGLGGGSEEGMMEQDGYVVHPRTELDPQEMEAVVTVLEYLIASFKEWSVSIVYT